MSLVLGLADRVALVRSSLPSAEVALASVSVRAATSVLSATLAESSMASSARLLSVAASHLDAAVGALGLAGDELDRYLASVGLSSLPPSAVVVSGSCPWADRVDVLTGCVGVGRPPVSPGVSVFTLLVAAAGAASAGDREGLRRALVTAPPSVGWSLAAAAARLIGAVAPSVVRERALPVVGSVLPGLSRAEGAALVDRALRLSDVVVSAHPADAAAIAAVVVGSTGVSVESLAASIGES
ncbi:hypothetical protein O7635_15885 [Asanoa sp. WMMD1127]|uniref:hypothetical protein n=1 Tax=Asanoa sp. WMMD1127 TaxID=3016107 RepID=UPI002417ED85|nr:hypothetical protein [Asanoa sp. WMMD1127]MDG4823336.1 hypothetical protein [Asanoa sp. WMMD1127]